MQDAILFIPEEQEMKLRTEDKQWLSEEITQQLEARIDEFTPHGWRKLTNFAKSWIPLGTALSVVIGLFALAGAGWNFAFTRVDKQARFEEKTSGRLDSIEKRLLGIENTLKVLPAQITISKLSTIPPKELKQHKQELVQAKNALATTPPDTPNVWPTGFEIISLLSRAQFGAEMEKVAQQREGVMDNVRSNPPGLMAPIRNNRIVLKNLIQGITFINSIVRFDPSVQLANDTFINCIFVFPADANQSKPLQKLGEILLTSDLSHVIVNAS